MTSTAVKRRRGTTLQHSTFTGLAGEITVDTDKKVPVVHDGATAGGWPLAHENQSTYRNVLQNAGFEIAQRGAGGSFSMAVSASAHQTTIDRWILTTTANNACVVSQQTGLNDNSQCAGRVIRNSGQTGTGIIYFEQALSLSQIMPLRGKKVALTGQYRAGANFSPATGTVTARICCGTGAAGRRGDVAYTGETILSGINALLATTSVKNIDEQTSNVVPANTTQMALQFIWTPTGTAGAADYVEFDDIQIEKDIKTTFERMTFTADLESCMRRYMKSFTYSVAPAQAVASNVGAIYVRLPTGASGTFGVKVQFGRQMTAVPTVTTYNPTSSNANWRDATNSADRTVTVANQAENGFTVDGASGSAGSQNFIHWAADSDYS